jgi:hypothetical protein
VAAHCGLSVRGRDGDRRVRLELTDQRELTDRVGPAGRVEFPGW